jgi:hypothetical protein
MTIASDPQTTDESAAKAHRKADRRRLVANRTSFYLLIAVLLVGVFFFGYVVQPGR